MSDRFFYPGGFEAEKIALTGTEAHHLLHVLRAQPGTRVELFDGRGQSVDGQVVDIGRKEAQISLGSPRSSPALHSLTLLTAAPKGDRFRWLVEKATELGVTRLIPIATERSVVSPGASKLHKLEQTVIAACKQSGRNWLMPIDELTSLPEALQQLPQTDQLLAAHPNGQALAEWTSSPERGCTVIVGPEGGFTEEECTLLRSANARVVSLGETILRTETAAIALASWIRLTQGR